MGAGNSKTDDKAFKRFVKTIRKDGKVFDRLAVIMQEKLCEENAKFLEEYYAAMRVDQTALVLSGLSTEEEKNIQDRIVLTAMYNKFICPGSKMELNLPSHVVKNFQDVFEKDSTDIKILDPVVNEVLGMVYQNIYPIYQTRFGDLTMKRAKSTTALENVGKQTSTLSMGGSSLGSVDALNNAIINAPETAAAPKGPTHKLSTKAKSALAL